MFCHYCGTQLSDGDLFCIRCGTRQDVTPAPQSVEPPMAEPVQEYVPVQPAAEPVQEYIPVQPVTDPVEEFPVIQPMVMDAPPVQESYAAQPEPAAYTPYQEKAISWQPYGAPAQAEPLVDFGNSAAKAPALQLPTGRALWKMILFSILTFGIYPIVIYSRITGEVNMVASRYDGERSMSYFGVCMLTPLTLGILPLVWINKLCRRIGAELQRRSVPYSFGAKDFWLWAFLMSILCSICSGVLSALIIDGSAAAAVLLILSAVILFTAVGPLVFTAKLMKAMNKMNGDYNIHG